MIVGREIMPSDQGLWQERDGTIYLIGKEMALSCILGA